MRFSREKIGYCRHNNNITANKDNCENWRSNEYRIRRLNKISINALNETIANLIEVTNIIKDDIEEKHLLYLSRERLTEKLNILEAEIKKEIELSSKTKPKPLEI